MPLVVEHLRRDVKLPAEYEGAWAQVEHRYDMNMTFAMSHLIEEDGGPKVAYGSGYGIFAHRPAVDHTFTLEYPLPDGVGIKKGDRIRMWREEAHGVRP